MNHAHKTSEIALNFSFSLGRNPETRFALNLHQQYRVAPAAAHEHIFPSLQQYSQWDDHTRFDCSTTDPILALSSHISFSVPMAREISW